MAWVLIALGVTLILVGVWWVWWNTPAKPVPPPAMPAVRDVGDP